MSWFKRKQIKPTTCEYGRYVHRPVLDRALTMVTGLDWTKMVVSGDLTLNNDKVVDLSQRLESGNYRIHIASLQKTWTFFIR